MKRLTKQQKGGLARVKNLSAKEHKKLVQRMGIARAKTRPKKESREVGKLGGRPPVKNPGYMTLKKRESRARRKKS